MNSFEVRSFSSISVSFMLPQVMVAEKILKHVVSLTTNHEDNYLNWD